MINGLRTLCSQWGIPAVLLALLTLTACGGGGGGGGGFLGENNEDSNPLTITTSDLPTLDATPYSVVITADGGSEPYTWTLDDDGGTGVALNAEGILSASILPPAGTYGLTISVSDSLGNTDTLSVTLTVTADNAIIITSTALPQAVQGLAYTALVEAEGGSAPYRWTVVNDGGTGLGINTEGVLTGTAPDGGDYGITLEVTDAADSTARRSFILTVTGGDQQPLAISTDVLPNANEGQSYSAILQASGGQGTYLWTLVNDGGTGLDLRDDGILRGTAPAEGSYGITVSVQDDIREVSKALILTVDADSDPLAINTTSLPASVQGQRYAAVINATGGSGNYTWSLVSNGGSGLSLSADGVLSGVTNTVGTFGLVFRVSDGSSTTESALTLTVSSGTPVVPLSISTQTLPVATTSVYAAALQATGGSPPYTWSLLDDGGSGLTLNATGALSGTTPAPGTYGLSVTVVDSLGSRDTKALTLTIQGGDRPPVEIITADLGTATYGQTYATVLRASGGQSGNYTWSLIEVVPGATPPPGLTFDPASGVITWAACSIEFDGDGDADGTTTYAVTIRVTDDGAPPSDATATLSFVAVDDPAQTVCP